MTTTTSRRRIDHETMVVHDVTGEPRNRLEQCSIRQGFGPPGGGGWKYISGWVDRETGDRYSLYGREVPLEEGDR